MWRAVVQASVGDLARRRTALVLLVALPFAVYAGTSSAYFLVLVAAWSIATLALYSWAFAQGMERRLVIVGARPGVLFAGRAAALSGLAVLVATVGAALFWAADRDAERPSAMVAALFAACLLAVPLGALVGQLLPRELEGTLTLMVVMGVHFAIAGASAGSWTRVLPFDGPARLVDFGYSGRVGTSYAVEAAVQCGAAAVVLAACAAGAAYWRLRPARVGAIGAES